MVGDPDIHFHPTIFLKSEADEFFQKLTLETRWQQQKLKMYGKELLAPRLSAWYGDPGAVYAYSGIINEPLPWTDTLLRIRKRIEPVCGSEFNSVLLNLYRNGSDSLSWHCDDEPELGPEPIIGSVSLGQERLFQMKHKKDRSLKKSLVLPDGSLLVMQGSTQRNWLHQIPKTKKTIGPRINLTFRRVLT